MSLSERRHLPRFPFHSRGSLLIGALDRPVTIMDISLSGALLLIYPMPDFRICNECKLTVFYSGGTPFLNIDGRVAHLHDHLIGIEFANVSNATEKSLRHLVDLNLGMHQLLDRDIPALLRKQEKQYQIQM